MKVKISVRVSYAIDYSAKKFEKIPTKCSGFCFFKRFEVGKILVYLLKMMFHLMFVWLIW